MKKILSIVITMCLVLTLGLTAVPTNTTLADTESEFAIGGTKVYKGQSNDITISLQNNTRRITGIELFVSFDTDSLNVQTVKSDLDSNWEIDYKAKALAKYGRGVHVMLQDTTLAGFTNTDKKILTFTLGTDNAKLKKSYDFKVYVIDISDASGNSIASSYTGAQKAIQCLDSSAKDIELLGLQYSTAKSGVRMIAAVEPEIGGQEVTEHGYVFGVSTDNVTADSMYVGSTSSYVWSFASTTKGTSTVNFTDSDTATTYVMTFVNNGTSVKALTQKYMVRAYAKLADGTYVYSDVCTYTIYKLASVLYNNYQMPSQAQHEFLYDNILSVVDSSYKEIDYSYWSNATK